MKVSVPHMKNWYTSLPFALLSRVVTTQLFYGCKVKKLYDKAIDVF